MDYDEDVDILDVDELLASDMCHQDDEYNEKLHAEALSIRGEETLVEKLDRLQTPCRSTVSSSSSSTLRPLSPIGGEETTTTGMRSTSSPLVEYLRMKKRLASTPVRRRPPRLDSTFTIDDNEEDNVVTKNNDNHEEDDKGDSYEDIRKSSSSSSSSPHISYATFTRSKNKSPHNATFSRGRHDTTFTLLDTNESGRQDETFVKRESKQRVSVMNVTFDKDDGELQEDNRLMNNDHDDDSSNERGYGDLQNVAQRQAEILRQPQPRILPLQQRGEHGLEEQMEQHQQQHNHHHMHRKHSGFSSGSSLSPLSPIDGNALDSQSCESELSENNNTNTRHRRGLYNNNSKNIGAQQQQHFSSQDSLPESPYSSQSLESQTMMDVHRRSMPNLSKKPRHPPPSRQQQINSTVRQAIHQGVDTSSKNFGSRTSYVNNNRRGRGVDSSGNSTIVPNHSSMASRNQVLPDSSIVSANAQSRSSQLPRPASSGIPRPGGLSRLPTPRTRR